MYDGHLPDLREPRVNWGMSRDLRDYAPPRLQPLIKRWLQVHVLPPGRSTRVDWISLTPKQARDGVLAIEYALKWGAECKDLSHINEQFIEVAGWFEAGQPIDAAIAQWVRALQIKDPSVEGTVGQSGRIDNIVLREV